MHIRKQILKMYTVRPSLFNFLSIYHVFQSQTLEYKESSSLEYLKLSRGSF